MSGYETVIGLKVIGSSRADFPSWPGAPKTLLTEAEDTFAV